MPPNVGAILLVPLRLPEMIIGRRVTEWSITGHVVHVKLSAEPAKYDVGVQFQYCEAAAPHRGRLVCKREGEHAPDADNGAQL
jgi:hypothetical protein